MKKNRSWVSMSQGVLGIDLGTTFSTMSYLNSMGTPTTIPNSEGDLVTPSVVMIGEDDSVLVGREAKRKALTRPGQVASCIKRDMGEAVFRHPLGGKQYSPQVLSAFVLKKLKQDSAIHENFRQAVITVPAYFDEGRRQATAEAGAMAGFDVLGIINEPTSAALAYAFRRQLQHGANGASAAEAMMADTSAKTVMVYDLGGGTFDVTILRMEGTDLTVLATDGAVELGGRDFDIRLADHLAEKFISQFGADPRNDQHANQQLLALSEGIKCTLSKLPSEDIYFSAMGYSLVDTISREEFEEMTSHLMYRTESRVLGVLDEANMDWGSIDELLMVGGSTRMPQVSSMLEKLSGRKPNSSLSADESVSHGAGIHGAILSVQGKTVPILSAHTETQQSEMMSPVDTAESEESSSTGGGDFGREGDQIKLGDNFFDGDSIEIDRPHQYVQMDQSVVQALGTITTRDVNSHSLGVEAHGRDGVLKNSILIPRNSSLPNQTTKMYGTVCPNQSMICVRVLEGESKDPRACVSVGQCVISPLPTGLPKGSPVEVTFEYDSNGRVHVHAKLQSTGVSARTVIERTSGIDDVTFKQMQQHVQDAIIL
jgi:molecular chaperone DnaK (HSP70)